MTAPVTLTAAKALVYAKTSTAPIIVKDSNDNIAANADALVALGAQIVSLQGNSHLFYQALSVAELLGLDTKTYYKGNLEVFTDIRDTAANIAANAAALESLGAVGLHNGVSIEVFVIDTAANVVATAATLESLAAVGVHNGEYLVSIVNDTAANVVTNATALRTLGAGLPDGLAINVSDTAAHVLANAAALWTLAAGFVHDAYLNNNRLNENRLTVVISDTAANVAATAFALGALAAELSQETSNAGHGDLYNTNSLVLTISDTAANVAANAVALGGLATELSKDFYIGLGGITNNNRLTIAISDTVANVVANAVALGTLAAGLPNLNNSLSISIIDTSGNVFVNLDKINKLLPSLPIADIKLTDTTVPTLAVTANQYAADAAVLTKITSTYHIAVTDSSANVLANLATLQANVSHISGITLTDTATPTLTIAASQYTADAAVLAKIISAYHVAVTDTAANVQTNLATLQANVAHISGITLTDTTLPTLTLTASQYTTDAGALAKINAANPYHLAVTGATFANFAAEVANTHVTSITVVDSAANINAHLSGLAANLGKLSGITFTDTTTPTLTIAASQYRADTWVLAKVSAASPYHLAVTGASYANFAAEVGNTHITSIAVVDSAANINAHLAGLETNLAKLSSITLTDATTPTLTLIGSQTAADMGALNAIQSPYLLSVNASASYLNTLNLSTVHTPLIEIKPTVLDAVTLTETAHITDLNLALINLTGDSINEKAYGSTGTEVDIVAANGAVLHQLIFTHNTEAQLQLLGIGSTSVHFL
ncbi:hypothetical protein [Methylovulum psychrotolerans]|uniref:Uncharacterized protein n=1 Tax=Methylovulum psychrotolerans TaxID=1704499 RepID=A0A2S5CND0_9GAMM|nr:hypothetical protein [Methylovulum psychrotolerans]POZ52330.1 hypothetical protein AADEFJLK_01811 [Methylovulum psychrotolerans]